MSHELSKVIWEVTYWREQFVIRLAFVQVESIVVAVELEFLQYLHFQWLLTNKYFHVYVP